MSRRTSTRPLRWGCKTGFTSACAARAIPTAFGRTAPSNTLRLFAAVVLILLSGAFLTHSLPAPKPKPICKALRGNGLLSFRSELRSARRRASVGLTAARAQPTPLFPLPGRNLGCKRLAVLCFPFEDPCRRFHGCCAGHRDGGRAPDHLGGCRRCAGGSGSAGQPGHGDFEAAPAWREPGSSGGRALGCCWFLSEGCEGPGHVRPGCHHFPGGWEHSPARAAICHGGRGRLDRFRGRRPGRVPDRRRAGRGPRHGTPRSCSPFCPATSSSQPRRAAKTARRLATRRLPS